MPIAVLFALLALPALADDPTPRCDAARNGALACMANRACRCGLERGGSLTGRAGGFRWDCGILRGECTPTPAGPVPSEAPPGLPSWTDPPGASR